MFAGLSRKTKTVAMQADGLRRSGTASAMPPFWELEALIAQGHPTTDALTIMARRHAEQAFPVILSASARSASTFAGQVRLSA